MKLDLITRLFPVSLNILVSSLCVFSFPILLYMLISLSLLSVSLSQDFCSSWFDLLPASQLSVFCHGKKNQIRKITSEEKLNYVVIITLSFPETIKDVCYYPFHQFQLINPQHQSRLSVQEESGRKISIGPFYSWGKKV